MAFIFGWLSRWPLASLQAAGAVIGWIGYLLSPTYRGRFKDNTQRAGISQRAARAAIAEAGRMLMELPLLWRRDSLQVLGERARCTGLEHVQAALDRARGIVMLTPHLGCFEIIAQLYAAHFAKSHGPITAMYRPARKPWLQALVGESRTRPGFSAVPATLAGVRQMMRALRRGEAVGLLPDQVPPDGMGEWAPFFGRDAYTMTLAARLVQQTGATPVLVWGERLPCGRGFIAHFVPFDEELPADATAQAESAAAVNRAMERLILRRPEQYLWGYHRYKQPRVIDAAMDPSTMSKH